MTQKPTLGRIVHYRGKQGLLAPRAAIVTATVDSLDQRGVEAGEVPALDSSDHVHLWVFTPSPAGGFAEFNVPHGKPDSRREPTTPAGRPTTAAATIPPGTWCWPPRV